ncbi:MarR family winged helix-turn-helix transcriptional regulator [Brachybacterium sp. YJGR34]|uniref:MarR family winged helix-turn-helix transcriptional regulator n=1 Tax=Brachybacterium sp. YJGR34 TaxID=2059911 RepID=UPI000E0C77B4|nr:MarR family transcriptional regulator [Brachybacterium sp. YJGR34]
MDLSTTYRRYLAAVVRFHLVGADVAGIGVTDYQAASLLDAEGPLTSGELGRLLRLSPSATTRAVDRLIAAGIAERTADPSDRRRTLVRHTGHMPDGLLEFFESAREPIGAAIAGLSDTQREGLEAYLLAATEAYGEAVKPE